MSPIINLQKNKKSQNHSKIKSMSQTINVKNKNKKTKNQTWNTYLSDIYFVFLFTMKTLNTGLTLIFNVVLFHC